MCRHSFLAAGHKDAGKVLEWYGAGSWSVKYWARSREHLYQVNLPGSTTF